MYIYIYIIRCRLAKKSATEETDGANRAGSERADTIPSPFLSSAPPCPSGIRRGVPAAVVPSASREEIPSEAKEIHRSSRNSSRDAIAPRYGSNRLIPARFRLSSSDRLPSRERKRKGEREGKSGRFARFGIFRRMPITRRIPLVPKNTRRILEAASLR